MKEYSEEAQRVLEALSDDDIKQLRRENPFRNERNAKIIELRKRGVKIIIISEISGLSDTALRSIIRNERRLKWYS